MIDIFENIFLFERLAADIFPKANKPTASH
jgi:hypothetical protein